MGSSEARSESSENVADATGRILTEGSPVSGAPQHNRDSSGGTPSGAKRGVPVEASLPQEVAPKEQKRPFCNPPDRLEEVTKIFQEISEERKRPLFVLVADPIDDDVCHKVYDWRKELRGTGTKAGLDIVIDSPGGSLTACYIVGRLFSRCSDSWEALVPSQALSGATLICLGSSNIVMSEISRLSPLDPQVISKRREKFFQIERQSPLEAFEAVRYLRRFSIESLDSAMKFLLDRLVTPHLALETASKLALGLVGPVIAKVEPYDLGALSLDMRIAIEYCKRIGAPANPIKKTQRAVDPRALVTTYPAHEFAIDLEEAKALNFVVSEPSAELDVLFDTLRLHLDEIEQYVGLIC